MFLIVLLPGVMARSQCIVINEIMINAAGSNDGSNSPNTAEWVELYNTCPNPIDIGCYSISDGEFAVTIPSGTMLAPQSYFTLGSGNAGFVVNLNWATCGCAVGNNEIGIFTNGNEQLILQNNTGVLEDAIKWGSGNFPINYNSSAIVPGCVSVNYNYAANNAAFEQLPSNTDGCSVSRSCDGANTWLLTCSSTPGLANNPATVYADFLSSSQNICAGDCINFTDESTGVPDSWAYSFEGSITGTSSSQNPQNICYPTGGDYDVSLVITSVCGTTGLTWPDYIHVENVIVPDILANGPVEFCSGENVVLSTSVTGNVQWNLNGAPIPSAISNQYTANASGDYSVSTTGNCSATSDTIEVNVIDNFTVEIVPTGNILICGGQDTTLTTDGIYDSYQWYLNGEIITGATNQQYSTDTAGTYTVEVTLGTCSALSEAVFITVISASSVEIYPNGNITLCDFTDTLLIAIPGFSTYQWYNNDVAIAGATTDNFTATAAGDYSVVASMAGCSYTSTLPVNINVNPVSSALITPDEDVQICDADYLLTATSNGNIQWYLNGAIIPSASQATFTAQSNGTYYFIATLNGICPVSSNAITLTLNTSLSAQIINSADTACAGETISLQVNGNYDSVDWNTGETSSSILVTGSGDYFVSVTQGLCIAADTVTIVFNEFPSVDAGPDLESDCAVGASLEGSGTGILTWYPPLYLSEDTIPNPVANPPLTTAFTLTARIGDCIATDETVVSVDCSTVFIPNAFTPDGDGVNDEFYVRVSGVAVYELKIFNRWGDIVFQTTDPDARWTGGKLDYFVPDGIYAWQLTALDTMNIPMLDKQHTRGLITVFR